jgi:uncharacterized protein YidB (DUF937 family)
MGILDSIANQVLGGGKSANPMIDALLGHLGNQQSGGLGGLVQQFAGKGLGDIMNSWVSTGKNLPISEEQLKQALGGKAISQIASKAGISSDDAIGQLTQLLPQVIDKLTPDGKIPQGDLMAKGMDLLKGLMK